MSPGVLGGHLREQLANYVARSEGERLEWNKDEQGQKRGMDVHLELIGRIDRICLQANGHAKQDHGPEEFPGHQGDNTVQPVAECLFE